MPDDENLSIDAVRQSLVKLAKHGIPWNIAAILTPAQRASWLDDIKSGQLQDTDRQQT